MTSGQKYCTNDAHLVMVGQPLATGFTSMGVGVSYDNPELVQVLSYWINELRTCNPMSPTSECYQGLSYSLTLLLSYSPSLYVSVFIILHIYQY